MHSLTHAHVASSLPEAINGGQGDGNWCLDDRGRKLNRHLPFSIFTGFHGREGHQTVRTVVRR